jgi:transmembrane sensor
MDELIRKMRERRLPGWDNLRERRVLDHVEAEIPRRRRHRRVRAAAALAAIAAAALVAFLVITFDGADQKEQRPAAGPSSIASVQLPDGSQAFVHDARQIEFEQRDDGALWVRQRRGTVRYRVRPRPRRRGFVVQAGPARVRVVGTIFSVSMEPGHVAVKVERGRVAVERGKRRALLGAGDEIRIRISSSRPSEPAPAASQPSSAPVSGHTRRARRPGRRTRPTLEALMDQVDAARRKGDLDRAARLIEQVIRNHAGDRRMAVVLFTQGRIEQARGRFRAAARAFGRCWTRFPRGSLAEDALAGQAGALRAAGSQERASAAARRYLSMYPRGIHRRRMKEILRR